MPEVVALELDLIFDLVDQNLGQEDAHQLKRRRAQAQGSPAGCDNSVLLKAQCVSFSGNKW